MTLPTNTALHRRLDRVLRRTAGRARTFAPLVFVLVIFDVLIVGFLKALYKPLWLDEIMELLIAKLSNTADIIAVCKAGADNQPIAYHFAMHEGTRLFSNGALALRIPSVLGYALFCLCLYWFVNRLTGPVYGLIAMLFPLLSKSWYYATEGRPYALMLACTGVAAVCWQSVNRGERRRVNVLGLGLALLCAVNLHYYAVLLFVPFWIAELVRTFSRRMIDWRVWTALTVPLLVLLLYIPIIRMSTVNSGTPYVYYARPSLWKALWTFADEFLSPSLVALLCLGVLYFVVQVFMVPTPDAYARPFVPKTGNRSEFALVLGFTLVPVMAILLSRFGTHIFFTRYAIAGVFGIAALLSICASMGFVARKGPAMVFVCLLAALIVRDQYRYDWPVISDGRSTPPRMAIQNRLPKITQSDNLPIVATNLEDFMQFFYYGDARLRDRLYYLASENLASRYLGFTFHDRMMLASAPYFGTQVVSYSPFVKDHPAFYVFGSLFFPAWVVPKLLGDHAHLQLLQGGPANTNGNYADILFRAEIPHD